MKKIFDIIPQSEIAPRRLQPMARPAPVRSPEPAPSVQTPGRVHNEPAPEPAIGDMHKELLPAALPTQYANERKAQAFAVLREKKETRPPLWKEVGHRFRMRFGVSVWAGIIGLALIGVLGTLTFLYPRVNIAIAAKQAEYPVTLFLTIDGNREHLAPEKVGPANGQPANEASAQGRIGGKYIALTEETTRTFPATGKHVAKTKARGMITIFNAYSTQPQSLVATTRFESSDGKVFRLISGTTIPGAAMSAGKLQASSIAVEVEADQPGSAYNIGPSDFTIPGFKGSTKFTGFYGKSYAPMKGGAEGETAIVRESDIAAARQKLRDELGSILTRRLNEQITAPWEAFTDATNIDIVAATPSVAPGASGDNFQMYFKLRLETVAFRKSDLETLLIEEVRRQVANPERQRFTLGLLTLEDARLEGARKTLTGVVRGVLKSHAIVDEKHVKEAILGKGESDLRAFLESEPEIETAKITFWPFWVKRVPKRDDLVRLTID